MSLKCPPHKYPDILEPVQGKVKAMAMRSQILESLKDMCQDIAILTLSEPIKFNKKVQPICLPAKMHDAGEEGIAIGWGQTMIDNDKMKGMLRETKLKIVTKFKKYPKYGDLYCNGSKTSNICAKSSSQKPSYVGFGDSGGPFMIEENNRQSVNLSHKCKCLFAF